MNTEMTAANHGQAEESMAAPLAHLSSEQIEGLYQRYLEGEPLKVLVEDYKIRGVSKSLVKHFPPVVAPQDCPYCKVPMLQHRRARNGFSKPLHCGTCQHVEIVDGGMCTCGECTREIQATADSVLMSRPEGVPLGGLSLMQTFLLCASIEGAAWADNDYPAIFHGSLPSGPLAATPLIVATVTSVLQQGSLLRVSEHAEPLACAHFIKTKRLDALWIEPNVVDCSGSRLGRAELLPKLIAHLESLIHPDNESTIAGLLELVVADDCLSYMASQCHKAGYWDFEITAEHHKLIVGLLANTPAATVYAMLWRAARQITAHKNWGKGRPSNYWNTTYLNILGEIASEPQYSTDDAPRYNRGKKRKETQLSDCLMSLFDLSVDCVHNTPVALLTERILRGSSEAEVLTNTADMSAALSLPCGGGADLGESQDGRGARSAALNAPATERVALAADLIAVARLIEQGAPYDSVAWRLADATAEFVALARQESDVPVIGIDRPTGRGARLLG